MINYITFLLTVLVGLGCNDYNPQSSKEHLTQMANVLNDALPRFRELYDAKGFYIEESKPVNFFIYNLIDTTENSYPAEKPIELKTNGVYHFSPIRYRFSYSHIAVIKNGELKVFSYLNCDDKGDTISDVVSYIEDNFNYDTDMLGRIQDYRSYGKYFKMDPQSKVECPAN